MIEHAQGSQNRFALVKEFIHIAAGRLVVDVEALNLVRSGLDIKTALSEHTESISPAWQSVPRIRLRSEAGLVFASS